MNEFKEAKEAYEQTQIPDELNGRVQNGIRQGRAKRAHRQRMRFWTGAVACLAVTVGALNLSPTVAAAAAEVPVLGGLFQLLTVRNDRISDENRTVEVRQPGLEGTDFAREIDAQIQTKVEEKLAEGERVVAESRDAFLATGGTAEEWAKRDTTVKVDYEVKSQTDTAVSFVVNSTVSVASAYQERFFYNLDLKAGKELTLKDLLGENWVQACNDAILAQMAAAEEPSVYFTPEMGGFTSVDESTGFYVNEAGNPVVVFPRTSVAIGALGTVEFEIAR